MGNSYRQVKGKKAIAFFIVFLLLIFCCSSSQKEEDNTLSMSKNSYDQGAIKKDVSSPTDETENKKIDHKSNADQQKKEYTPQDLDKISGYLEELFDDLEASMEEPSEKPLTIQAIIDDIGADDPERLFDWVRDNTFFVPYRGSLKGPEGVLIDRLGNSLDRSLLLHGLLDEAGYDARLVYGSLSTEQTQDVLKKVKPIPKDFFPDYERPLSSSNKELIENYSQKLNIDKAGLLASVEEKERYQKSIAEKIPQKVDRVYLQVLHAVQNFHEDAATEEETISDLMREHWWVQLQRNSEWVDLDPILSDSSPGVTLAEVEENIQPDDLDEDIFHRITIRVIIEQWKDKGLEEHEVLNHTLIPQNHLAERITLHHSPGNWPEELEIFQKEKPSEAFKDLIMAQKSWLPILQVGLENIRKFIFNNSGEIEESGRKKDRGSPGGLLRGFPSAMTAPKSDKKEKEEAYLTAEWIEYDIDSPGMSQRTIRRQIFDLIGPSKRLREEIPRPEFSQEQEMNRNLFLLGSIDILPLCCQLSEQFIRHLTNTNLMANKDIMLSLFQEEVQDDPESLIDPMSGFQSLPFPMYMHALHRSNPEIYLYTPNLLSYHSFFQENLEGSLDSNRIVDIVENKVGVSPTKRRDSFLIRLRQGIHDSLAESFFMTRKGDEDNLSRIHSEAEKQGIAWLAIQDSGDESFSRCRLSKDTMVRIEEELSEGFVIIAPEKEVYIDGKPMTRWWRIDPETGDSLIIGEFGWGQAAVEYIEDVELILQIKGFFELLGDLVRCVTTAATELLGPRPEEFTYHQCILEVICNQMYSEFEDYCDLETNWTNFIIKQLIAELASVFCEIFSGEM